MTNNRRILLLIVLMIGILLAYVSVSAKKPVTTDEMVIWDLTKTVVVDPGKTVTLPPDKTGFPGGILTTGYILEAKAKAKAGKLVPEGTFRLTMSVFTPNKDYLEQKAGTWYVQGEWTVIDKQADQDPQGKNSKHNKYKVEGRIHAALPFNPVERQVGWSSQALIPMSLAAGQWARGSLGVLTLNSQREGDLYLTLKVWPQMP